MSLEHQGRIRSVASLVTQMAYATFLFLVIGLLAVVVHVAIQFCRVHHLAPLLMIEGTEVLAVVMWIFDVVCFGLFMFTEVIDFWKSMVGRAR